MFGHPSTYRLFGLVTALCAAETVFSSQHPRLQWLQQRLGQQRLQCSLKNTIFNLQHVKVVELEVIRLALCWDQDSCRQHVICQKWQRGLSLLKGASSAWNNPVSLGKCVQSCSLQETHRILPQVFIAKLWFRLSALTAGGPRHRLHSSHKSNVLEHLSLHLSPSGRAVKSRIDVEGIAFYPLRKKCPGSWRDLLLLCLLPEKPQCEHICFRTNTNCCMCFFFPFFFCYDYFCTFLWILSYF